MSQFEFKLPDIGEGVTEGEIVNWLVSSGDSVAEDQDIVEVMTDKATVTIGSPRKGEVLELRGEVGDVIPVGGVLMVLEVGDGAGAKTSKGPASESESAKGADESTEREADRSASGVSASAVGDLKDELPGLASKQGAMTDKPLAAPATRRLARELGIDLQAVQPSGPGGRITREDVQRHAKQGPSGGGKPSEARRPQQKSASSEAPRTTERGGGAAGASPVRTGARADERIPIRGIRKRIYENMARSKHTAAHFTYVEECDVALLKEARKRAKAHAEAEGATLTFLPFIVKAVVSALKRHPALNSIVDDDAQEIVRKGSFDIGIAVATEAGLTVPVLRNADHLSMLEIGSELQRLSDDARSGKTRREDLGGSSFTITSLGKLGGLFATPVVNYPEVAILGVHEIKRRPVVRGDEIVVGEVMLISVSFDHRIIDGHVGAAFAQEVRGYLENPDRLLVELR